MPRVKGIFASPSGQIIHAAVGFDDYVVETVPPKIRMSPFSKYNDEPVLIVVEIPVTALQYKAGSHAVEHLVQSSDSCINWASSEPANASALVYTAIFQAMFPHFLKDVYPSAITPQVVYDATVDLLNTQI